MLFIYLLTGMIDSDYSNRTKKLLSSAALIYFDTEWLEVSSASSRRSGHQSSIPSQVSKKKKVISKPDSIFLQMEQHTVSYQVLLDNN